MSTTQFDFSIADLVQKITYMKKPVFFHLNSNDGKLVSVKEIIQSFVYNENPADVGILSVENLDGAMNTNIGPLLRHFDEQFHHFSPEELALAHAWFNFRVHNFSGLYQKFDLKKIKNWNLIDTVDQYVFNMHDPNSPVSKLISSRQIDYVNDRYTGMTNH